MIKQTVIEIDGEDVPVEVHYEMVDGGIGAYEFWGCKGYDSQIGPEINDIIPEIENREHSSYIDENFDDLANMLYEKLDLSDSEL